ncbi:MAG: pilus assembly protein TadG-related protein, partial [Terriglobales bacterium]
VGAMAALSIDVVTLYTARSEAQLAADGAALAGARELANSGLTSTTAGPIGAEPLAIMVATQVATGNSVGGRALKTTEVAVTFNDGSETFTTDPHVTVTVQRSDLPTFFARVWGVKQVAVGASATAEAYNPSGAAFFNGGVATPVAPLCVKPWLLPNIDPTQTLATGNPIFNSVSGAIVNPNLVGEGWPNAPVANPNTDGLYDRNVGSAPRPGRYYAGAIDAGDFPAPTQALPACGAGFTTYELAIAGCVPQPISCGATINMDVAPYVPHTTSRNADTVEAVECLIHYNGGAGQTDSIDGTVLPSPPFQFLAGSDNPVTSAVGNDVLVSDSLVTIPVINNPPGTPVNPVTVIGFLQVFLNPQSATMPLPSPPAPQRNQIAVTIINMVGCGTGAAGQPLLGNGASPVAVRLISPP